MREWPPGQMGGWKPRGRQEKVGNHPDQYDKGLSARHVSEANSFG